MILHDWTNIIYLCYSLRNISYSVDLEDQPFSKCMWLTGAARQGSLWDWVSPWKKPDTHK